MQYCLFIYVYSMIYFDRINATIQNLLYFIEIIILDTLYEFLVYLLNTCRILIPVRFIVFLFLLLINLYIITIVEILLLLSYIELISSVFI